MLNTFIWKSLISRIHPPLPLDPRGTVKLLYFLKSSFQRRLDLEHPPVQSTPRSPDTHLYSILSNPLFSISPARPSSKFSSVQKYDKHENLAQVQYLVQRPLDFFKDQVSSGTATLRSAKVCLRFEMKKALASSTTEWIDHLKSSKSCSVVMGWLWSSGMKKATYLKDTEFCILMIPFLILDSREDVIWGWLKSLEGFLRNSSSIEERTKLYKSQAKILMEWLKFQSLHLKGLDSAIETFVHRAVGFFYSKVVLQKSADFLIGRYVLMDQISKSKNAQIEPLILTVEKWSLWPEYHRAFLELYANENPRPKFALQLLRGLDEEQISKLSERKRLDIVSLSLISAEFLLSRDFTSDAIWIMRFLQRHFAKDLSIPMHSKDHSKASGTDEEMALQSLSALAMQ